MNRILEDVICGAIGYGIGKRYTDKDIKIIIDEYLKNVTLDDLLTDYAKFHDDSLPYQESIYEKCQYGMDGSYC